MINGKGKIVNIIFIIIFLFVIKYVLIDSYNPTHSSMYFINSNYHYHNDILLIILINCHKIIRRICVMLLDLYIYLYMYICRYVYKYIYIYIYIIVSIVLISSNNR